MIPLGVSAVQHSAAQSEAAPRWLDWAREIQALAQTGNHYAENDFQRERYHRLTEIAAEIIGEHSLLSPPQALAVFADQDGYATPRVDVRAAVFRDGKLLMVQERSDGGWTLPGGWADVGDLPSRSAEREVSEEAGYTVRAVRLIGVYDCNRTEPLDLFHAYKIIFLCNLLGGEGGASAETSAAAFFGREEIPQQLSGNRTLPRHVDDAFAAWADPLRPAVFD
ncbi:MAG: NUDIX hydrolase [Chloroflexi bacterium]|nr:NUDIX hydrolase [Chloroflexota bacterium]